MKRMSRCSGSTPFGLKMRKPGKNTGTICEGIVRRKLRRRSCWRLWRAWSWLSERTTRISTILTERLKRTSRRLGGSVSFSRCSQNCSWASPSSTACQRSPCGSLTSQAPSWWLCCKWQTPSLCSFSSLRAQPLTVTSRSRHSNSTPC